MHGSGRCGQVLKVYDAKQCSSHSSILALLAGVHSNGTATGRTGTTVRGGQEHESIESVVCAKPPAPRPPCLSVDLVVGCWVTGGLPLRQLVESWGIQSRAPSLLPVTGISIARPHYRRPWWRMKTAHCRANALQAQDDGASNLY